MIAEDPDGRGAASPDNSGQSGHRCTLGQQTVETLGVLGRSCYYPAVGRAGVVVLAVVLPIFESSLCNNLGHWSL